jgi:hypothetical protein
MVAKLSKTFGHRSPRVLDYLRENWPSKEIPGIACPATSRTLGHMGTMSMFEKLGFTGTDAMNFSTPATRAIHGTSS